MPNENLRKTLNTAITSGKIAMLGIAWYEEADYAKILEIMSDRDRLPQSHSLWLAKITQEERRLIDQGARVIRVVIKPEHFAGWCAVRGLQIDAKARTRFASEQAADEARRLGLI